MKITLGPIPFLWEKERILSFYKEVSATPVSAVYLGEVVCSKRSVLGRDTIEALARMLSDAGKEVVVSTLGLITHRDELNFIESLCSLPLSIEVNNIGVLNLCSDKSRVIGGPHLAIYNAPAAKFLAGLGIRRIVFMPELSQQAIESLSLSVPSVEKEIIAFGNLPLAFSWRCYTARALNLSKTNCAIVCKKYPSGMPLDTMEGM
ncbi:MAG TPA: U32 family peptidase, partial [Nitrospirota bacterium]|nr:U32 family peptidase [Nitrospirota bacterium]